jgi:signal transduction histidine kinase
MLDHLHAATQFHYHDNLGADRLPGLLEVGLYRITQEAVNNILKYSQADEAFIQLTRNLDSVQLTIEDNGKGFNTDDLKGNEAHQGLSFMQSRVGSMGGTLEISSEIGKGTWIFVEIPLNQD